MTASRHSRSGGVPRALLGGALAAALLAAGPAQASAEEAARFQGLAARSLERGAAFIVSQQHPNGSFGQLPGAREPGELGVTALVLRSLAGIPDEVRSAEVDEAVDAAVAYLLEAQQPDGSFSPPGTGLAIYRTSIAITALSAVDPTAHADAIRRGRDFVEGSQFSEDHRLEEEGRDSPFYGGWGYDRSGTQVEADMSNTHFALEALRAAGLDEESEVWDRAAVFLQRCQNRSESNDVPVEGVAIGDDGGFMYDPALDHGKSVPVERPDGRITIPSYASITYTGLLSMVHAYLDRDDPRVQAAWGWITRHYTLTENYGLGTRQNPQRAQQGLFYYYHVFAKALDAWGEVVLVDATGEERHWARELTAHLAALQGEDGSWKNDEPRWWESDPVLATGYALLALEHAYPWLDREPDGEGRPEGSSR